MKKTFSIKQHISINLVIGGDAWAHHPYEKTKVLKTISNHDTFEEAEKALFNIKDGSYGTKEYSIETIYTYSPISNTNNE